MRRGLLTTLILLTFVTAAANPADARRTATAKKAKKLYKAGKKAYAEERYSEAAKHFSAGYMLDPKPGFLLNIAQSYRKADEPKEALHYYQEYLKAAPDSKLRAQVSGLISELEEEVKAKAKAKAKAAEPDPTPTPVPEAAVTTEQPPPPPPPRSVPIYKKWWFWTGVAVVVGTGIGIGVYAGNREPDYVKEGGLGSVSW